MALSVAGCQARQSGANGSTLEPSLDQVGPYHILVTPGAKERFAGAVEAARKLHPGAVVGTVDPNNPKVPQARYTLLVMLPEEISVDFAWRWLWLSTQLDEDPLVDVMTGYITGETPEDAEALVRRAGQVASGEVKLPGLMADNLGPNTELAPDAVQSFPGSSFLPVFTALTVSHGKDGFRSPQLLKGAGLVHFGGHGYPDRIVEGLTAEQVPSLELSPSVVFNGACYTGVTSKWYENGEPRTAEKSFCLELLKQPVAGYLAALHPDHGMPVYQEMEYLAYTGASLGEVIKQTHDAVILGFGGELPQLPPVPASNWGPSEVMLYGTASRVLFGDPALRPMKPITQPPYKMEQQGDTVRITVQNDQLKSSFTDTFHSDLSQPFNDRVKLKLPLPTGSSGFEVKSVEPQGSLVGKALEIDGDRRWVHIQIDYPATGFFQSERRVKGAAVRVELVVR